MMTRNGSRGVCCVMVLMWLTGGAARAEELSIRAIQYTEVADGASPVDKQTVDCAGGIVIHKYPGSAPKLTLYDPADPSGWGGIVAKDWSDTKALFNTVAVGDWVSLAGMVVEEYRGNTVLRYEAGSSFAVKSTGNALPAPLPVTPDEIAAPLPDPNNAQNWYVADHRAEKYEAMLLVVEDVAVTAMDLGKNYDNYNLHGAGDAWAADYMNSDRGGQLYLPQVVLGAQFASVTGILEQYTNLRSGWDYYQLLTRTAEDLVAVPEPSAVAMVLAALVLLGLARARR